MEKSNPYSFYVVLADGIMEIPQDSNLSWITLFYALPKELVEKRPAYLELPRNIHQLLHSEEYRKLIESETFLELVWDCYAWAAWQFFQLPGTSPATGKTIPVTFRSGGCPMKSSSISGRSLKRRWSGASNGCS